MKFYIKQKVFTLKDHFNIMNEEQEIQYQVKGKFMSISDKLQLLDKGEQLVLHAKRKVFSLLAKYYIYNIRDEEVAVIQQKFQLFRPKFKIYVKGKEMDVEGSLFAHSFTIMDNQTVVASIQKKIISWGDTYAIEIFDEENVELLLFTVIVLDQVIHERRNR